MQMKSGEGMCMEYRRIFYREASGEEGRHSFEYQINFVMEEGSISYLNKDGGVTTRGAILQKNVLDHFELLLNKGKPEQYRDGKNLKANNCYYKTDSGTWEILIDYTDGRSQLRIDNSKEDDSKIIEQPGFVVELKKYAIHKLGLEDAL